MKTDEEIYNSADAIIGAPFKTGEGLRSLLLSNGHVYPFINKRMLNPLDPVELLLSVAQLNENYHDYTAIGWVSKICRTVYEASRIRKYGYSIVTKYKSGAPRVVLDNTTNDVIILGELASSYKLILPILSTQLADDTYKQSDVEVWRERGFKTPQKYDTIYKETSLDIPDPGTGFNYISRKLESWSFGGYVFKLINEEGEISTVSDEENRDFDYEGYTQDYLRIEEDPSQRDEIPNKIERPAFIWQDKGVRDED